MTAPDARDPQGSRLPRLHAVGYPGSVAANADAAVLRRYDTDLDAAYEQARQDGDLTPLVQTVRRWWFEADAWRDPRGSARVPRPHRAIPARRTPQPKREPGGKSFAPRTRLERATCCLGGTADPALCRPASTHVAGERNSSRQLLSDRSSPGACLTAGGQSIFRG